MSQLTVADVKPHLGLLGDAGPEIELLIQSFLGAAWTYMQRHTRRDLMADFGPDLPEDLLQAQRMLVAHYFRNREAVGPAEVEIPLGVKDLLAGFRAFA